MERELKLGHVSFAVFTLGVLTLSSLSVPVPITAEPLNQGLPTTNIGGKATWLAILRTKPVKKMVNNRPTFVCPRGFSIWEFGLPVTSVKGNVTRTQMLYNPKKFLTTAWVGGGTKRIRQLTPLCQQNFYPMEPKSRAELSQWTFVSEKELAVAIGVQRPPVETCVPAAAPTSWQGTVVSNDLVKNGRPVKWEREGGVATTSLKGTANGTGIWTVRWNFTGGQGFLVYDTRVQDKDGVYRLQRRQVLLNPSGTEIEVTEMLSLLPVFFDLGRAGSWQAPGILPDCGQGFLPSWLNDWSGGSGESVPFDVGFEIIEPMTNPEVRLQDEGVTFEYD